jgi:hypothetical protein
MAKHRKSASEAHNLWSKGKLLSDAWYDFADDRNKKLLRKLKSERVGKNAREVLMQLNLQVELSNGVYRAFGVRHGDYAKDGPCQIPAHFFEKGAEIDWDESSIKHYGCDYSQVRIIICEQEKSSAASTVETPSNSIGRPRLIHLIEQIIRQLRNNPEFHLKLKKQKIDDVRKSAREQFPEQFARKDSPARSTINQAFQNVKRSVPD